METAGPRTKLSTDRPAVLFVSVPVGVGGSTRSMANVLTYFGSTSDADNVSRVLAAPVGGRFVDLVADLKAADVHLPIINSKSPRPPRRAWQALQLVRFVRRNRGTIRAIHANGLKELSLTALAASVGRVPLVVWIHNFKLPPSVRRFGWLWRIVLRRTQVRFAAVSPLARDLVVQAGLARAADVEIVPNPIDPNDVQATEHLPDKNGAVRVAFLGTPLEYKGFQLLPEMIERTAEADPNLRWLLFSKQTDHHLSEVWDRLREMESTHPVSIEGKFTDVREAYARCDIVVCPSLLESFCRVAAEAMLNGIPVVGSDLEPIQALLGADEAGIVYPAGDTEAASKAIVRLAADPDLRDQLGQTGIRRAQQFSPESVAAQLRGLLLVP
ncbi:MAG TPA: glycosyltransferase family 4 protein [Acidimicrobiales bacterium]